MEQSTPGIRHLYAELWRFAEGHRTELVVNAGRVVDQGSVEKLRPRCRELVHFLRQLPGAAG